MNLKLNGGVGRTNKKYETIFLYCLIWHIFDFTFFYLPFFTAAHRQHGSISDTQRVIFKVIDFIGIFYCCSFRWYERQHVQQYYAVLDSEKGVKNEWSNLETNAKNIILLCYIWVLPTGRSAMWNETTEVVVFHPSRHSFSCLTKDFRKCVNASRQMYIHHSETSQPELIQKSNIRCTALACGRQRSLSWLL